MKAILRALLLSLIPGLLSAGIFTLDFGAHQDFLDNGLASYSTATLPSVGFSFGGKTPGWHFRLRIGGSVRDFEIALPSDAQKEISSTIRGFFGVQWIFEEFCGFYPFVFTGLQYRFSEVKYLRSSLILYNYSQYKRVSIPFSAGFFVLLPYSLALSFEAEADIIPLSSYQHLMEGSEKKGQPAWYNELGLALYLGIGFYY